MDNLNLIEDKHLKFVTNSKRKPNGMEEFKNQGGKIIDDEKKMKLTIKLDSINTIVLPNFVNPMR